jgi:hypothetical protein
MEAVLVRDQSVRYRPHPHSDRLPSPMAPRWLHDLSPARLPRQDSRGGPARRASVVQSCRDS